VLTVDEEGYTFIVEFKESIIPNITNKWLKVSFRVNLTTMIE
jgi:hypothetical protein